VPLTQHRHEDEKKLLGRSRVIADPTTVVVRLHQAQNRHDVGALAACFAPDYQSAQSIQPDRALRGRDQVRTSWSIVFRDIPDFQADMLRVYSTGDTVWAEWRWHGTPAADERFNWHGITLFGIKDDQIAWGHCYMEPDQTADGAIGAVVGQNTTGSSTEQATTSIGGRPPYAAAPSKSSRASRACRR
jgi:ketosteroid isomerase-like protein